MSHDLTTKYIPAVDELFSSESKKSLLTNTDYDWSGAHSVMIWKVSTAAMNDYKRHFGDDDGSNLSLYGPIQDLEHQTEEMLCSKDRSFIFSVDRLDCDETGEALDAKTALARQLREVVIPEVDTYTYGVMAAKAGTAPAAVTLTAENIYEQIVTGSQILDDGDVPDTRRVLVVTPATYRIMKQSSEIFLDCDISEEMRLKGVVAMVDGMAVVKIPANRLPEKFGFMIAHPSATVAPTKLESYGTHPDTPLCDGGVVTGRICYDAFVLENKAKGIYHQAIT